jgi:hypothetical protein
VGGWGADGVKGEREKGRVQHGNWWILRKLVPAARSAESHIVIEYVLSGTLLQEHTTTSPFLGLSLILAENLSIASENIGLRSAQNFIAICRIVLTLPLLSEILNLYQKQLVNNCIYSSEGKASSLGSSRIIFISSVHL